MHLLMVPAFVSLTASLCLIVQHDHMYYNIQYLGGHNSGEEDISLRKRGGLIFRIFLFYFFLFLGADSNDQSHKSPHYLHL